MDDLKYLIHENDQLRALVEAALRQRDDARSTIAMYGRWDANWAHSNRRIKRRWIAAWKRAKQLQSALADAEACAKQYHNELEMIVVLGREQGVTLEPSWVARIEQMLGAKEQTQ